MSAPLDPSPVPQPARVRVTHYALLAGLTALVPLPYLDAWLERRAHRAMYRAILEDAGHPFDHAALDTLTEDRSSLLVGCLGVAFIWPIKKLFRTFFYFLTIKDLIDGTAEATLRAAMVRVALARLPTGARAVRDAMEHTLDRHQYSPVSRWFFRGHRPVTEWVANGGRVDRFVGWVYQKAGGGVILTVFVQRLGGTSPVEAPR